MNLGTIRTLENVPVGDDAIGFDEEATASRKLLTACVESFYRDGGRFNPANQFGEKILLGSNGSGEE